MLKGEGVDEETVGGNKGNNRSGEAAGGDKVRRGDYREKRRMEEG